MAKKYYAVRKGRVPGIYDSWDECSAQVSGFPDAEFKGFKTRAEAEVWFASSVDAAAAKLPTEQDRATQKEDRTDYGVQLEEKATAFVEFLQENGIQARDTPVRSEYYRRIWLRHDASVDLYHTINKPNDLRSHLIKDPALQDKVTQLWKEFLSDGGANREHPEESHWDVVEHYFYLLKPYASLNFDFIDLAIALRSATPDAPDPDSVRYNFERIEAAYHELKPRTHE